MEGAGQSPFYSVVIHTALGREQLVKSGDLKVIVPCLACREAFRSAIYGGNMSAGVYMEGNGLEGVLAIYP